MRSSQLLRTPQDSTLQACVQLDALDDQRRVERRRVWVLIFPFLLPIASVQGYGVFNDDFTNIVSFFCAVTSDQNDLIPIIH